MKPPPPSAAEVAAFECGCHIHLCVYCKDWWVCAIDHSNGVQMASTRACADCKRKAFGELHRGVSPQGQGGSNVPTV